MRRQESPKRESKRVYHKPYRVLPKGRPEKRPALPPIEVRVYDVPLDCVALVETVMHLEQAMAHLLVVDHWHLGPSHTQAGRESSELMLRSQINLLRSQIRYAKRKLATEFLAK